MIMRQRTIRDGERMGSGYIGIQAVCAGCGVRPALQQPLIPAGRQAACKHNQVSQD